MNTQRLRIGLLTLCGCFAIGSPVVMAWGFLWPVGQLPTVTPVQTAVDSLENGQGKSTTPTVEDFGSLLDVQLRHQLVEPATAEAQRHRTQKVEIPLQLNLLATMIESGHTSALFSMPDGVVQVGRVGETVGKVTPAEVVQIEPSKVIVRYQGQLATLQLPSVAPHSAK